MVKEIGSICQIFCHIISKTLAVRPHGEKKTSKHETTLSVQKGRDYVISTERSDVGLMVDSWAMLKDNGQSE